MTLVRGYRNNSTLVSDKGVSLVLRCIVGDGTDQQASNYGRYCPEAPVCRPSGYSSIKRGVA